MHNAPLSDSEMLPRCHVFRRRRFLRPDASRAHWRRNRQSRNRVNSAGRTSEAARAKLAIPQCRFLGGTVVKVGQDPENTR